MSLCKDVYRRACVQPDYRLPPNAYNVLCDGMLSSAGKINDVLHVRICCKIREDNAGKESQKMLQLGMLFSYSTGVSVFEVETTWRWVEEYSDTADIRCQLQRI